MKTSISNASLDHRSTMQTRNIRQKYIHNNDESNFLHHWKAGAVKVLATRHHTNTTDERITRNTYMVRLEMKALTGSKKVKAASWGSKVGLRILQVTVVTA